MAGPVAAAWTSLPTNLQATQTLVLSILLSQLVTAPSHPSPSRVPRLPIPLLPQCCLSSMGFRAPPFLLSLPSFLPAARGDPSIPAGQTQSCAHFPPVPAPPGPRTQPLSTAACRELYSVPTFPPASTSCTCYVLCLEYSSLPPLA